VDLAALVRLAIEDARASLSNPDALWIAPELGSACPTRVELALIAVEAVDAGGHTTLPFDAPRVWGVSVGPVRFSDDVLRGARLERLYTLTSMLTFDAAPVPAWHVRRVAPGVSARDVQSAASFPLFAGPDLTPMRDRE
jgi:hypothetical protein